MSEMAKGGYPIYGQAIGVLLLDHKIPRIKGDMGNALTFDFPVRYRIIKGVTAKNVIDEGGHGVLKPFIEAAKELEEEGVKAIAASGGFLSMFQEDIARAVKVPVFTSALMLVPLVHRMLGRDKRIGIITASKKHLSEKHLKPIGIESIPICIVGMEDEEEFRAAIRQKTKMVMDVKKVENEMVKVAKSLVEKNPDVGAIVFECADFPPYAKAVQKATNLPVFDIVTLTNMVYQAVRHID